MASPAYLNGISSFLTPKNNRSNNDSGSNGPKISYWSPGLGVYNVRLLKMKTEDNTPILPLLRYGKPLVQKSINAPIGWGMEDPINEQFEALRKTKEGWEIAKNLKPQRCFFAAVLVRGEEDKGVRIWEVKEAFVKSLYGLMLSDQNKDEDLLDYNVGYDMEINIVPLVKDGKVKLYEGKPCKQVNAPILHRRPSPLHSNKAEMQKLIDSIPDFFEQQKRWVKSPEDLIQILEEYMVRLQETQPVVATSSDTKAPAAAKRGKGKASAEETTKVESTEGEVDADTEAALGEAFDQF
jgi:hypothetical protein